MGNDQLNAYLRESLAKGSSPEELLAALVSAGWNGDDVKVALREILGQAGGAPPTAPPQTSLTSTPVVTAAVQLESQMSTYQAPVQAVSDFATPLPAQAQTAIVPEMVFATDNNGKMKKVVSVIIAVAVFVITAGTAAGYFFLMRNATPAPEIEIALMQNAMKSVHAYAFDTRVKLDMSSQVQTFNIEPEQSTAKFALIATGTVNIGETASTTQLDMTYSVDGNLNYSAVSVVIDGAIDARVVDKKLYLRIAKIPQALALLGVTEIVSPWKGKWIAIDSSGVANIDPALPSTFDQYTDSTTSEDYRNKATAILKKNWPFVLTTPKEDPTVISGAATYHYQFSVNREKLYQLIIDLSALYPAYDSYRADIDKASLLQSATLVSEVFSSTTGDFYIGMKNAYLYRTNIHVPITIATSSFKATGNLDIAIEMSQFNSVAPILAPTDVTSVADVYKSITKQAEVEIPLTTPSADEELRTIKPGQYKQFAQCLKTTGTKMYGTSWCPHCKTQKEAFGDASSSLPYVECSTKDGAGQLPVCKTMKIVNYPTWVFKNGTRLTGEQTIETLAEKTNCPLPVIEEAVWEVTPLPPMAFDSLSSARQKSRDAKRISDIGQIQLALELYFDAHQGYPLTLAPLSEENFIPMNPLDSSTRKPYAYLPLLALKKLGDPETICSKNPCASYVLGASLERNDNYVLQNDADVNGVVAGPTAVMPNNAFVGGDDYRGCRGEPWGFCYDIKP